MMMMEWKIAHIININDDDDDNEAKKTSMVVDLFSDLSVATFMYIHTYMSLLCHHYTLYIYVSVIIMTIYNTHMRTWHSFTINRPYHIS